MLLEKLFLKYKTAKQTCKGFLANIKSGVKNILMV